MLRFKYKKIVVQITTPFKAVFSWLPWWWHVLCKKKTYGLHTSCWNKFKKKKKTSAAVEKNITKCCSWTQTDGFSVKFCSQTGLLILMVLKNTCVSVYDPCSSCFQLCKNPGQLVLLLRCPVKRTPDATETLFSEFPNTEFLHVLNSYSNWLLMS